MTQPDPGPRTVAPGLLLALAVLSCSHAPTPMPAPAPPGPRLAVSEGRLPAGDGVELFYRMVGEGPDTVVVVHGGVSGLNTLELDMRPLARGRTLVFYDQRGYGRSTLLPHDSLNTWRHVVADLEAVRVHLGLERLKLVGHSQGGRWVGLYAMTHPDRVARLVLIGASAPAASIARGRFSPPVPLDSATNAARLAHWASWRRERTDSVKACWDYWSINGRNFYDGREHARRGWADVCNEPQATMLSPVRGASQRSLGDHDVRADMAAVMAPALVVHGDRDPSPAAAGLAWADALPASRLFVMPGSGHLPHVDRPEVFFPAVDAFLRGAWPEPPRPDGTWTAPPPAALPPASEPTPYERLFAELGATSHAAAAAVTAGDWERAASFYTTDALLLAPGAPPVEGRYAIAAFWRAAHGKGLRRVELQTIEVEGMGELALELGKYMIRDEDGGILDVGKFMAVLRREPDGWRLYRDAYNSSLETRSPLEVPDHLPPPDGTWAARPR